jgi:fermentation-respiration switch protein FrsA (DUF1100 family)
VIAVTIVAALVVAALILALWWQQERIVFQPTGPPFPAAVGAEHVTYQAEDGQPLFAFVVGDRGESGDGGDNRDGDAAEPERRKVVIAFHGNADLAAWLVPWAETVAQRSGWIVVLPEYRGYAGLPGAPSVLGAQRDARAAAAFVRRRFGADARVALFGHSLGSAIAAELAAESAAEIRPAALILEAPFTSAREMARIVVVRPIEWVWGIISRVHYDTVACVARLEVPVSVAHGDRDLVVPVRMGQRVFAAARLKGATLIARGAGHCDVAERAGEAYWKWLARALKSVE